MDAITLRGPATVVADDVKFIKTEGAPKQNAKLLFLK